MNKEVYTMIVEFEGDEYKQLSKVFKEVILLMTKYHFIYKVELGGMIVPKDEYENE